MPVEHINDNVSLVGRIADVVGLRRDPGTKAPPEPVEGVLVGCEITPFPMADALARISEHCGRAASREMLTAALPVSDGHLNHRHAPMALARTGLEGRWETRRLTEIHANELPALLLMADGRALHVGVRAEVVPARDGSVLGFFLIFDDLTQTLRAAVARRQLEQSLSDTKRNGLALDAQGGAPGATDDVMSAVLANASIAAMDIADGGAGPSVASLLEEIDHSAQRAATLYSQIRAFRRP